MPPPQPTRQPTTRRRRLMMPPRGRRRARWNRKQPASTPAPRRPIWLAATMAARRPTGPSDGRPPSRRGQPASFCKRVASSATRSGSGPGRSRAGTRAAARRAGRCAPPRGSARPRPACPPRPWGRASRRASAERELRGPARQLPGRGPMARQGRPTECRRPHPGVGLFGPERHDEARQADERDDRRGVAG